MQSSWILNILLEISRVTALFWLKRTNPLSDATLNASQTFGGVHKATPPTWAASLKSTWSPTSSPCCQNDIVHKVPHRIYNNICGWNDSESQPQVVFLHTPAQVYITSIICRDWPGGWSHGSTAHTWSSKSQLFNAHSQGTSKILIYRKRHLLANYDIKNPPVWQKLKACAN